MAFVPISVGSKYKGVLNMFGSQYDYIICFTEVDDENKTFMYNHKLLMEVGILLLILIVW